MGNSHACLLICEVEFLSHQMRTTAIYTFKSLFVEDPFNSIGDIYLPIIIFPHLLMLIIKSLLTNIVLFIGMDSKIVVAYHLHLIDI